MCCRMLVIDFWVCVWLFIMSIWLVVLFFDMIICDFFLDWKWFYSCVVGWGKFIVNLVFCGLRFMVVIFLLWELIMCLIMVSLSFVFLFLEVINGLKRWFRDLLGMLYFWLFILSRICVFIRCLLSFRILLFGIVLIVLMIRFKMVFCIIVGFILIVRLFVMLICVIMFWEVNCGVRFLMILVNNGMIGVVMSLGLWFEVKFSRLEMVVLRLMNLVWICVIIDDYFLVFEVFLLRRDR